MSEDPLLSLRGPEAPAQGPVPLGAGGPSRPIPPVPAASSSLEHPLATGRAGCARGAECASEVCIPDVTGAPRCCEADCALAGRVCDELGVCVCATQHAAVRGECRRLNGTPCERAEDCASDHCADGVCCDAACDGVCERCDVPGTEGACSLHAQDPECPAGQGFTCFAPGRCRLPLSLACSDGAECNSDQCQLDTQNVSVCCASSCDDVCQRCGPSGACDAHPTMDERCPAIDCAPPTICRAYRIPAPGECSANGACAGCEPLNARAGTPCGVAQHCDGRGDCRFTGVGKVAAGPSHTCAVRDDGNVVCWGSNRVGQLGAAFDRAQIGDDEAPAGVPGLALDFDRDVWQLTAGSDYTCALLDPGGIDAFRAPSGLDAGGSSSEPNVRCWGAGEPVAAFTETMLGTSRVAYAAGTFVDPLATGNVELPAAALQISAGGRHTCAVLASGEIGCWGMNAAGQLGNGEHQTSVEPARSPDVIALERPAWEVRAGGDHTCALDDLGRVTCWGSGLNGQLGLGDSTERLLPGDFVDVGGVVTQLATGFEQTCALLESGNVRCWGRNNEGELGYGHSSPIGDNEAPAGAARLEVAPGRALGGDVPLGAEGVVQITALQGFMGFCALLTSGRVRCWGDNDRGQLGYGHRVDLATEYTPAELARLPLRAGDARFLGGDLALGGPVRALAEGGRCALRMDGALYCFGVHTRGQLGLPSPPRFPEGSLTLTPEQLSAVDWEVAD